MFLNPSLSVCVCVCVYTLNVVGQSCETHGNANLEPRSAFSHDSRFARFSVKCPRKSTNRAFIVSTDEPDYRQYRSADFKI